MITYNFKVEYFEGRDDRLRDFEAKAIETREFNTIKEVNNDIYGRESNAHRSGDDARSFRVSLVRTKVDANGDIVDRWHAYAGRDGALVNYREAATKIVPKRYRALTIPLDRIYLY